MTRVISWVLVGIYFLIPLGCALAVGFTGWFGGWYSVPDSQWWVGAFTLIDNIVKVIFLCWCGFFAPFTTMTVGYGWHHDGQYGGWFWVTAAVVNDVVRYLVLGGAAKLEAD